MSGSKELRHIAQLARLGRVVLSKEKARRQASGTSQQMFPETATQPMSTVGTKVLIPLGN